MPKKSSTAPSRRHWSTISERTSDEPLENTRGGNTPRRSPQLWTRGCTAYFHSMKKHKNFSQDQNQKPAGASRSAAAANLNHSGIAFAPSADEVARRVYFAYGNQGSLAGHEVQDWLEAEAQLLAERNLTRVHCFHNRT
jgi:hypothetical protein